MTQNNWTSIESKVISLFEEHFDAKFDVNVELKDLEKWSSLTHILFLNKLEDEFQINFEPADAVSIVSTTSLLENLKIKCQS